MSIQVATSFDAFAEAVLEAIGPAGENYSVGLSGGSTIPPVLKSVCAAEAYNELASKVLWTWIDERLVPYDADGSNFGSMKASLGEKSRYITVPFADGQEAQQDYQKEVSGDQLPELDLLILGFGDDGHIASLFPGCEALDKKATGTDWLFRSQASYAPVERWSWAMDALVKAKKTIVVYKGSADCEKAERLDAAINDPSCDTPLARFIQQTKGELSYFQVDL